MNDPEFSEHLPLLVFVDGRLAGPGTLHQRPGGWKRHIEEVYFLTHPDFRGMGVLDMLLEEIIDLSRHRGLTKLESSVNGERKSAIESMVSASLSGSPTTSSICRPSRMIMSCLEWNWWRHLRTSARATERLYGPGF